MLTTLETGRLQFLDFTLHRMIQRFEDEYPETRIVSQPVISINAETSSQNSAEDGNGSLVPGIPQFANSVDETAVDDEDTDQYAVRLSRSSSITSLHSRALTSEEGHAHRLGQNIRRGFLSPTFDPEEDDSSHSFNDSHVSALREKLDRLHEDQARSHFESVGADKAFGELGSTVDELWAIQRQDTEAFEKFKQSQIAAQINSGKSTASPMHCHGSQPRETAPEDPSS